MQKFFLHLRRGDRLVRDDEGQAFQTVSAAREAAAGSLRELGAQRLLANERLQVDSIDVCDSDDRVLATVNTDEAILPLLPWRLQKI